MRPRHLLVSMLIVVGCGYRMPATYAEPVASPAPAGRVRVGTARVDITPPPGVSTFGHAADSLVSDGVWTRLYCRAFAFETDKKTRLAIVPCDLAAISTLLQRSVAARLTDVLPTTRLMLSATHTHAGPAHYFDAEAFSNAFSSHLPGFDPAMVSFLADRIAAGVRRAFESAKPAALRFAHYEGGSDCPDCGMWGITWNRSLEAHATNHEPAQAPAGLSPVEQAIDPALHVLRVDQVDPQSGASLGPIGALSFFAMHPTVLGHGNRLLGADTHGIISREIERRFRQEWAASAGGTSSPHDPLLGVVNTNEGDIAPKWFDGTKSEAIAIGKRVAARIAALLAQSAASLEPKRLVSLDVRYREVDLPRAVVHAEGDLHRLCELPEPGESFAHGACDHPGDFDAKLLFPGRPYGDACQAPKRGLAGQLGVLIAGGDAAFPSRVPLSLVRLDDTLISFVPAELTIAAGAQVRRAVLAECGTGPGAAEHAVIAGLSNGYFLYVTTRNEFGYVGPDGGCARAASTQQRQSYEAGSNLYGPWTAAFLAEQLGLLAHSMRSPHSSRTRALEPAIGEATSFIVSPGFERPRLARGEDVHHAAAEAGSLCTLPDAAASSAPTLCFAWTDLPPGSVPATPGPWLELRRAADGHPVGIDDRGWDFVTRARDSDTSATKWSALVRLSADEWSALGAKQMVFLSAGGLRGARSARFSREALPLPCEAVQAAYCGAFDEAPVTQSPFPGSRPPSSPKESREAP